VRGLRRAGEGTGTETGNSRHPRQLRYPRKCRRGQSHAKGRPLVSVPAPVPSRFKLHFTPTSASWLNLVERFFAEITSKRIRRGSYSSVDDLDAAIYD
jgi:hypothetical protein